MRMKDRACVGMALGIVSVSLGGELSYPVVDTGQDRCYDTWREIRYPSVGASCFGQDAQYSGSQPSYRNNRNGTVTDLNTGLMWQADPGAKKTYAQAVAGAARCRTGGYNDWRLPTIKELYSLIDFSGTDPDPRASSAVSKKPFINTRYFNFQYGKTSDGERIIDSQWATSTLYVGKVMNGQQAMFGVNFADGRIKGYPTGRDPRGRTKTYYVIYVRGNANYGKNDFVDNGDGTVTDRATGLTWMKVDSGKGMDWPSALKHAEEMDYAGHSDWRLPNAKELQSIVDYTRSPDTTRSAAIDPVFTCTRMRNEAGQSDYGHYWSSTTHVSQRGGSRGVYIAFGRGLGYMHSRWMDVHGAGCQRSDAKSGNESDMPQGHGSQGDAQRINNFVRLVRGGTAEPRATGPAVAMRAADRQSGRQQSEQRGRPQDSRGGNRHGRSQLGGRPTDSSSAGGSGGFVTRLDRDGDGRVSRQEFDGPSQHFPVLDKNSDGYLSETEAPPPPPNGHFRPQR
ncbi:MAG: DUF1566 domain-containing protein [Kiritimatiellae bacterium]|nr:DUF1566 domain-containing protein [Kiritimatiellia bacterium]